VNYRGTRVLTHPHFAKKRHRAGHRLVGDEALRRDGLPQHRGLLSGHYYLETTNKEGDSLKNNGISLLDTIGILIYYYNGI